MLLIGKTTTLHVHHAFLYISLPALHDYDLKMTNFMFCRGMEHKTTTFFFFSWTLILSFRIQLQKKKSKIWRYRISALKFEAARLHFFKWCFRSCSRLCWSLLPKLPSVHRVWLTQATRPAYFSETEKRSLSATEVECSSVRKGHSWISCQKLFNRKKSTQMGFGNQRRWVSVSFGGVC